MALTWGLDVKAKFHDIAVLHQVVLTFKANLPFCLSFGHRTGVKQVCERYDLGANEASLEVSVNDPGSFWSGIALIDSPSARFFWPCGQVRLQAQRFKTNSIKLVHTGFFTAGPLQHFLGFFL